MSPHTDFGGANPEDPAAPSHPDTDEATASDVSSTYNPEDTSIQSMLQITRIMKHAIPRKRTKIANNAKVLMQECVNEFISFINLC